MGHFTTTGVTVYVACLASYNAGKGYGAWFDLDDYSDLDELGAVVNEMLSNSPVPNAEEYRIDDFEMRLIFADVIERCIILFRFLVDENGMTL